MPGIRSTRRDSGRPVSWCYLEAQEKIVFHQKLQFMAQEKGLHTDMRKIGRFILVKKREAD
jgi:hypothetical protein